MSLLQQSSMALQFTLLESQFRSMLNICNEHVFVKMLPDLCELEPWYCGSVYSKCWHVKFYCLQKRSSSLFSPSQFETISVYLMVSTPRVSSKERCWRQAEMLASKEVKPQEDHFLSLSAHGYQITSSKKKFIQGLDDDIVNGSLPRPTEINNMQSIYGLI